MVNRRANFINMVKNLKDVSQDVVHGEVNTANKSPYRQGYHIESESGSLGDPNGFSYFNHRYHLFYQWTPLAFSNEPHYTHHGWKHLISDNLIDWIDAGAGIESDTVWDKYGTYSGSAIDIDDKLFLMYTGNTWENTESEDDWYRVPYQLGAIMNSDNHVKKLDTPLFKGTLNGYTAHFRDPKIFKKNDTYYAVIGIQRENLTGSALLTKSTDLLDWDIIGEINTPYKKLGYMWECPDYYELDGHGILQFCPQGLPTKGNKFKNIYQNGYLIGSPLDLKNGKFKCGRFQELDKGFDFYAMQTMEDKHGRRLLFAWMGLPETKYPTEKYHYTGCMIFPRQIKIKNGVLIQEPISEIKNLYQGKTENYGELEDGTLEIMGGHENLRDIQLELELKETNAAVFDLFADEENEEHVRLIFNRKKQEFIVNRGNCGKSISEEYGFERSCHVNLNRKVKIRILQDISSLEIFLNGGKDVFSMRVFPNKENTHMFLTSNSDVTGFNITVNQLRGRK